MYTVKASVLLYFQEAVVNYGPFADYSTAELFVLALAQRRDVVGATIVNSESVKKEPT